jgi:hypothetical protein
MRVFDRIPKGIFAGVERIRSTEKDCYRELVSGDKEILQC